MASRVFGGDRSAGGGRYMWMIIASSSPFLFSSPFLKGGRIQFSWGGFFAGAAAASSITWAYHWFSSEGKPRICGDGSARYRVRRRRLSRKRTNEYCDENDEDIHEGDNDKDESDNSRDDEEDERCYIEGSGGFMSLRRGRRNQKRPLHTHGERIMHGARDGAVTCVGPQEPQQPQPQSQPARCEPQSLLSKGRRRWPWDRIRSPSVPQNSVSPTFHAVSDENNSCSAGAQTSTSAEEGKRVRFSPVAARSEPGSSVEDVGNYKWKRSLPISSSAVGRTSANNGGNRNKNGDDNTSDVSLMPPSSSARVEKKMGPCIGSIFGLDVGGTLAKLVYFEKRRADDDMLLAPGGGAGGLLCAASNVHWLSCADGGTVLGHSPSYRSSYGSGPGAGGVDCFGGEFSDTGFQKEQPIMLHHRRAESFHSLSVAANAAAAAAASSQDQHPPAEKGEKKNEVLSPATLAMAAAVSEGAASSIAESKPEPPPSPSNVSSSLLPPELPKPSTVLPSMDVATVASKKIQRTTSCPTGWAEQQPARPLNDECVEEEGPHRSASDGNVRRCIPKSGTLNERLHISEDVANSSGGKGKRNGKRNGLSDSRYGFFTHPGSTSRVSVRGKDNGNGKGNGGIQSTNVLERSSSSGVAADFFSLSSLNSTSSSSVMTLKRSSSTIRKSVSMVNLFHSSRDRAEALHRFYNFVRALDWYDEENGGNTGGTEGIEGKKTVQATKGGVGREREGLKDHHLSFHSRELDGEFHFVRLETRRMADAMDLIRAHNLHLNIAEMGATGGGAHKYASQWDRELGIKVVKFDELDCLVAGMQFVLEDVVGECYTFKPAMEKENYLHGSSCKNSSSSSSPVDEWWWSRKVKRDIATPNSISSSSSYSPYPYLLVTIGTGVSVLRVDGPRQHERISGSTIGGGTYWGLSRLLTDVEKYKDALNLASKGDPSKVDMMVGDIYGADTSEGMDALRKLNLSPNVVASSFGKLVAKPDPAADLSEEDLARALLMMVTNNIGQVAYLNARLCGTSRIYFVGNFLRQNRISQQRLSFAINYWSKGEMEALFLEHEGYFGALGAFLLSQGIGVNGGSPKGIGAGVSGTETGGQFQPGRNGMESGRSEMYRRKQHGENQESCETVDSSVVGSRCAREVIQRVQSEKNGREENDKNTDANHLMDENVDEEPEGLLQKWMERSRSFSF